MLYGQRLKELENAQRLLAMEADLHRKLIRLESAAVCERLKRTFSGQGLATGNPWLLLGATVAGVLAFRRWRGSARWLPMAMTAWRCVRWWFRK